MITNFFTTEGIILTVLVAILFLFIQFYNLAYYLPVLRFSRKSRTARTSDSPLPPVSIILSAHNEATHLKELLPQLLTQDYPQFEVIVIDDNSTDDTIDLLKRLKQEYSHLHHSFVPSSARYVSRKKLSLTLGVKASHYDWLLFTEPDCRPSGNQWLRLMARNFTPDTDVVLGYSRYNGNHGILSSLLAGSYLLRSLRYLSMALTGHPYTGSGRNLAYRKSLFQRYHGYSQQLNLKRGEDFLFVNQAATPSHTRIELHPDSVMQISQHSLKGRLAELGDYDASSRYFQGAQRYIWGLETTLQTLFGLTALLSLLYLLLTAHWLLAGLTGFTVLLKLLLQFFLFRQTARQLGHPHTLLLPWFLFGWQLFESLSVKTYHLIKGERPFRRS